MEDSGSEDVKPKIVQIFGGGMTVMNFANGTMEVPNFIITNVQSLSPGANVQNSIPISNLQNIMPVKNVPNISPATTVQNIIPISNIKNIINPHKINSPSKIQTITQVTKARSLTPTTKTQELLVKKENVVTEEIPQWMKTPIRKYEVKRKIPFSAPSSSKVQNVTQDHAYINKHQSPIIRMNKIIPSSYKCSKTSELTCRLCLKYGEHLTPMFWGPRAKPELRNYLKECCSVEVDQNDPLPKAICSDCRLKLLAAWDFRNMCQKSDNELRTLHKLPRKDYSASQIKKITMRKEKSIQVESYERSRKFGSRFQAIKQENNTEQEIVNEEEKSNEEKLNEEEKLIEIENLNEVEKLNEVENDDEQKEAFDNNSNVENSDPAGNLNKKKIKTDTAVSDFLESFAQEISNDAENMDDNQPTEVNIEESYPLIEEPIIDEKKIIKRRAKKKPKEKENLLCHICPRSFTTKAFLDRHTRLHLTKKTYTCETCSKVFQSEEKLTVHLRVHDKTKRFECHVCGLKFTHEYLLRFHMRFHGMGKPLNTEAHYLCEVCSKTFVSQSGLRHHQQLHMGLKPYKCRFCEKTFTMPIYRKKHEVRHTDSKQFKCHMCPAAYASGNGLKNHLLLHTGEAHYHCKTCGKSFRRRKYLTEHTFTHTGEKPFACKMCGVAYGNSGSLFAHRKRCRVQFNDEVPVFEHVQHEEIVGDS